MVGVAIPLYAGFAMPADEVFNFSLEFFHDSTEYGTLYGFTEFQLPYFREYP